MRRPPKIPWAVLRKQWQRTQQPWPDPPPSSTPTTQFFMGN